MSTVLDSSPETSPISSLDPNETSGTVDQGVINSLIICSCVGIGLVLLILLAIHLTRRFGFQRDKSSVSIAESTSSSLTRRWQSFAVNNESFGDSPCEFIVDSISLVAVRNLVEVAFPALGTSSVRTSKPLPPHQVSCYFETEIITCDYLANICIGLATNRLSSSSLPGHSINSIGYSSLDGQLYCNGTLATFSTNLIFSSNDVIGCGYFPHAQMILFTKNGERIAYLPFNLVLSENELLYPTIASSGSSTIKCNFGQKRFTFREANQNAWGFGVYSEIEVYDLPAPPPAYQPSNPNETNSPNYTPSLTHNTVVRRTSCTPHPPE